MVCLADPAVRKRARRDIKNMIDQRLTYRKETLLRDEVPPIPNVKRTPKELSKSPVYKRTKTMIPRRINKILVNKSRQVFKETSTSPGSPERAVTINTTYLDSDHDFGYYNRTKRKKSTTIQDLTLQLKETRRLLDVLKESEEVPEVEETSRDKPVRRKIEMEPGKRRPEPKVADFVSAKELDCESIGSDSELELSPRQASPGREEKFGVKSSYQDEDLQEFEQMERSVSRPFSKRSHSGGSTVLNESDPFTDSDYMEIGVNLQEELDISKEYESDAFSMCSEKISHMEARKMLSESEKRFSAMLESLDQDDDPDDSFLENERLMQQHSSKLDDILSIPSSVEDLRFDKEELPLLTRSNSDTGSTVTDKKTDDVMVPVRQNLQDRPALKFSKQAQGDGQGRVLQPTPIKPVVKKPVPDAKAKENIDFKNYESDLNEIENLLFKYDEYRLEQEQKKSEKKTEIEKEKLDKPVSVITKTKAAGTNKGVKDGQSEKISDGIVKSKAISPPKTSVVGSNISGKGTAAGIKTGIAKGTTTKMATKKPLVAPKPVSPSKVSTKQSPTKNTKISTLTSPGKTVTKSPVKDASPKKIESSAINKTAGIKTAAKVKPSSASGESPSKILPAKKISTTAKTDSKDSPDKKLSKVAVSPGKVATKTKTTSPAKIIEKPASTSTTSPVKRSNVSGPSPTTEGVLKPPLKSVKKPSGLTSIRPSPPKKLTKLTPASSLGKSKGNYVKSAMMATTKPPANDDNGASAKVPSTAANKDASSVKKAAPITTKTVAKSSPTKVTPDSKVSSPKSKVSPVKLSAGVKSTIPKPNSSATVKTVKPSSTLQKPKSSAEEKNSSSSTSKPAVSMKPEKSDLPTKPSIASKLASSVSSSSKANPVPKASGLVKPSATKVAAPKSTSQTVGKDLKTNPVKSTSKLSPKKEIPTQKITASSKTPTDPTQEKASSAKESVAKKTVPKPVSKLPPPKATSTPIKRTEQTTKSNLSPTKSKGSTTANVSPAKTSVSPTKSSTASSKSPSKSNAIASANPSKLNTVASTATSKSSAATRARSNSATIKSPKKSALSSPKAIKKPSETSKTTASAKKSASVQPEVVTGPESETNQSSSKSNDKTQPPIKSPAKAVTKIPSPSKSSVAKIQSVDKSQPSKASVIQNAKSPTKPEVSPKPKIKSLTRTSSAKTIPKPKPVMRF